MRESDGMSVAVNEEDEEMASDMSSDVVDAEPEEVDVETESPAPEEEPFEALPLDQVFEILKNQRRRYVLQYLKAADEPVEIGELSEQIAAWENDKEIQQISSSERKRVYVGLYQCHLPKMDGMDIVEFNKPRGVIELGPRAESLEQYLDVDDTDQSRWTEYFVGLSLFSAGILTGAVVLEPMLSTSVVTPAAVFVVVTFLACSLAYFVTEWDYGEADSSGQGTPVAE